MKVIITAEGQNCFSEIDNPGYYLVIMRYYMIFIASSRAPSRGQGGKMEEEKREDPPSFPVLLFCCRFSMSKAIVFRCAIGLGKCVEALGSHGSHPGEEKTSKCEMGTVFWYHPVPVDECPLHATTGPNEGADRTRVSGCSLWGWRV